MKTHWSRIETLALLRGLKEFHGSYSSEDHYEHRKQFWKCVKQFMDNQNYKVCSFEVFTKMYNIKGSFYILQFTQIHIKNRWKSLKKSYFLARKKKENGEVNYKSFHYFHEMDSLFVTHPVYFGASFSGLTSSSAMAGRENVSLFDFDAIEMNSDSDYFDIFTKYMNGFFEYKRAEFRKREHELEIMRVALEKEKQYFAVLENIKNTWKLNQLYGPENKNTNVACSHCKNCEIKKL